MDVKTVHDVYKIMMACPATNNGTYNFFTYDPIEYPFGFQVSFVRPEAFKSLTEKDWDTLTNYYIYFCDSPPYIGIYCNDPEISFRCRSKEKALNIMEEYNQESILDWKKKKQYPTEAEHWFILNREYDEHKVVDYEQALRKIL